MKQKRLGYKAIISHFWVFGSLSEAWENSICHSPNGHFSNVRLEIFKEQWNRQFRTLLSKVYCQNVGKYALTCTHVKAHGIFHYWLFANISFNMHLCILSRMNTFNRDFTILLGAATLRRDFAIFRMWTLLLLFRIFPHTMPQFVNVGREDCKGFRQSFFYSALFASFFTRHLRLFFWQFCRS